MYNKYIIIHYIIEMRVCVVMFYDSNISEYGDINYKINKIYCEKHNLDLIMSNEKTYTNRHSMWERFPLILKHIENYDYVVWIDADAFFYIDSPNIIEIINNNLDVNFIFSKDCAFDSINTGFFIVKNTQYSIDFINKWAYDEELEKNNPTPYWPDQGVLIDMINKNILDIRNNNYSTCDYGILQHFYEQELCKFQQKPYIYHLAGRTREERLNASITYYNKITQQ